MASLFNIYYIISVCYSNADYYPYTRIGPKIYGKIEGRYEVASHMQPETGPKAF
jgi:hypothetical protein